MSNPSIYRYRGALDCQGFYMWFDCHSGGAHVVDVQPLRNGEYEVSLSDSPEVPEVPGWQDRLPWYVTP